MAGRRWRSTQRGTPSLLPLQRARQLNNTVSCWYCDLKIITFNDQILSLGHRFKRFFKVWFAIGVGFTIAISVGVTLILLRELFCAANFCNFKIELVNLSTNWLLGTTQFATLSSSLMDVGVMICSTLVAIVVHEFGHALAATSQGIQIEYVAMFLAVVLPGAFVAFNYDLLQNSSLLTALRVYCAGIWHNAVLCAVCLLTLFLLPSLLHPLYLHVERPVVLSVDSSSPLSSYLSQGDAIVSLDGTFIKTPQEWREKLAQMDNQITTEFSIRMETRNNQEFIARKGYCVPSSWVEINNKFQMSDVDLTCPDELSVFASLPCSTFTLLEGDNLTAQSSKTELKHCLTANDVVMQKKCGEEWERPGSDKICACSEDELCVTPVQSPGVVWVEISFARSSPKCLNSERSQLSLDPNISISESVACGGTFVFVGDASSLVYSILLSSYKPRWATRNIGLHLPMFLEKILSSTFHASASLALFNSLPAFFLDGESILEAWLLSINWLRHRVRRRIKRLVLGGGSLLAMFVLVQIFLLVRKLT